MTSKPAIGPMLRLVLAVGAVLSPMARPLLKRRLVRGKEDPDRWLEKLGQTQAVRPFGPLVWLHGVGVGEVMALRGLIAGLSATRPDLHFLVTSSARSSGEVFARNLPPRTQHQYLPLDFPAPVAAFLDHWHPDLAVWSDQEVWPRLAVVTARRGVAQALVAARITGASMSAKARFGSAYGDLYRLLDLRHTQDDATATHLRDLMADETPVTVTGSLKAAAAPLVDDPSLGAQIEALNRPVWVAASAHRADIDIVLGTAFDGLLIIAPRDLNDADYIATACRTLSLSCVKRSANQMPDATTQVFIADSFGELGTWYRVAFAALIGGTFDDTQGHNPWEAVALNCAVLHGPNTRNFAKDFADLAAHDAARLVTTPDALADALTDAGLPDMAARASDVRARAADGMAQTTDALLALLKS